MNIHEGLSVMDDAMQRGDLNAAREVAAEIRALFGETVLGRDTPWSRYQWDENWVSIDGTDPTGFPKDADNILHVVAWGETSPGWDGESAGIVALADGRYCSWESSWGPTGSGFSYDAYGGDAVVGFAKTLHAATNFISENRRELLNYGSGTVSP